MTLPTPEQNAALVAGQPLLHIGAHSVGVKDGGPGIPVLYLSTQGGDIRLPHLLGIHAVQALPLLSWLITSALAHLRERTGLMWTGLRISPCSLALRAQPITSPDALTLAALAGLIAVTLIATLTILERSLSINKHKVLATKICYVHSIVGKVLKLTVQLRWE